MIEHANCPSNRSLKGLSNSAFSKSWPVIFALLFCLLQTAAVTVTPVLAMPQDDDSATESIEKNLTVVFVDQESGEPVAGVDGKFNAFFDQKQFDEEIASDKDGRCELSWEGDLPLQRLIVAASKQGYVPLRHDLKSTEGAIDATDQVELKLVKGKRHDGLVVDETGDPIANAKVRVYLAGLESGTELQSFWAADLQTDEQGQWTWDGFPSKRQRISVFVTHPDFIRENSTIESLETEKVITLKRGLEIRGRVVDAEGSPLEKASVTFGRRGHNSPSAITDSRGRFRLTKCESGPSAVTVQAKSFAPKMLFVDASPDLKPLKFEMHPGNRIRIKVVDSDGESIDGAGISVSAWQKRHTINLRGSTDANGNYVWEDAPPEPVEFDIQQFGYVSKRGVSITAGGKTRIVTLSPKLVIIGSIKSKDSGEPIDNFEIISGFRYDSRSDVRWSRKPPVEHTDGHFEFSFSEPRDSYYLKVFARGYEAKVSRAFKVGEGLVKYDFNLRKGFTIRGVLRRPDGTSVSNAKVAYVPEETKLRLTNGLIDVQEGNAVVVTTDRTGRFTITPTGRSDEAFMLLASDEEGIATFKSEGADGNNLTPFNPKKILTLKLQPWGNLKGTVFTKKQPDANRKLIFSPTEFRESCRPFRIRMSYWTTSDGEAKYEFQRLPEGAGDVSKPVSKEFNVRGSSIKIVTSCWQTPATIVSEETASVDVTKVGVAVKGSVTTDKQPGFKIDWPLNKNAQIESIKRNIKSANEREAASSDHYFEAMGAIDSNGNFAIPDVPAGRYKLTVTLSRDNQPGLVRDDEVGKATVKFTVKDGRSEPLDLGEVVVKLRDKS